MRILTVAVVVVTAGGATGVAYANKWADATANCIGDTGTNTGWTSKVEIADVDGDGLPDILMANGGDYDKKGAAGEATRIWKNLGNWDTAGSHCTEISAEALGNFVGYSRVIKAADIDGDGDLDLVTGGAYQTQLVLWKRDNGTWVDATAQLPQQLTSVGDLEFGDVDGDGDLDIVLAEWGATAPGAGNYQGGRTRLYLNDGTGTFTDATASNMPDLLIKWSWDLEFVDVDNDWDLDILVSCKTCIQNHLFRNDGSGHFTDIPDALPHRLGGTQNNYEFEPMDIDGDGDLDLVTINDGGSLKETLLLNDGTGRYTDASAQLGSNPANIDDNTALWLDVDSDGDADLLIGSLGSQGPTTPDRLLLNDGHGTFTLATNTGLTDTPSTLGLATADLDGDGRLDLVQGQGEAAFPDKVELATAEIAVDVAPPVVRYEVVGSRVFARIHDYHSGARSFDFKRVFAMTAAGEVDLTWYGEFLYTAPASGVVAVCAIDRAGNMGCNGLDGQLDGPSADGLPPVGQTTGCCDANTNPSAALLPLGLVALALRRRRVIRSKLLRG